MRKVSIGWSPISLKKKRCSRHLRPIDRSAGRRKSSLAKRPGSSGYGFLYIPPKRHRLFLAVVLLLVLRSDLLHLQCKNYKYISKEKKIQSIPTSIQANYFVNLINKAKNLLQSCLFACLFVCPLYVSA
jgi:hypothetical protein